MEDEADSSANEAASGDEADKDGDADMSAADEMTRLPDKAPSDSKETKLEATNSSSSGGSSADAAVDYGRGPARCSARESSVLLLC